MPERSDRFAGRVGFVTGGASGIGEAIARRFASEGGRVAVVDRSREPLERVVADIEAGGGEAVALPVDVTSVADVDSGVRSVLERWCRIDVLVNNAGLAPRVAPVIDLTDDDFRSVMDVNFFGAFVCTRAVAPSMIENGYGRIVHIGSRSVMGEPRMSVYAASKAAMTGFTKSIVGELGPHGITVNVVGPGSIMTPMMKANVDHDARVARLLPTVPVGRVGEPEDIAAAVLFLGSEEAGYITGQELYVTGGRYHSSTPMGSR